MWSDPQVADHWEHQRVEVDNLGGKQFSLISKCLKQFIQARESGMTDAGEGLFARQVLPKVAVLLL